VVARCDHAQPPFARLRIISVRPVNRARLTRADARREGLRTLTELHEVLDAVYPEVERLLRIRFMLD
jgi:uncharacterized protein YqfB (UPF0267 family)